MPRSSPPPSASYSCIDTPMTSWPCSASRAAATDESTPPDIATTILIDRVIRSLLFPAAYRGQASQFLDKRRQRFDHAIDVGLGIRGAEAESDRSQRARVREAHRLQH